MSDEIKKLNVKQQCREKLPIFYGSRDNYIHGLCEVLGNSSDEITNNFDNGIITVELLEDMQTIIVKDTGRGIPINEKIDGEYKYVALFQTLFAGTNFDNKTSGKIAVGTNGCGTCVLNHTSKIFKVEVGRQGKVYEVAYSNGGEFKHFKELGTTKESYTKTTFKLDSEVYTNTIYNIEDLKEKCRVLAATNNKILVNLIHNEEISQYHYKNLREYYGEYFDNNTNQILVGENVVIDEQDEKNIIEVVLSTSSEPRKETFLNFNFLKEGGTIELGVINGIKAFFNNYSKANKKEQFTNQDIEDSFSFAACISSSNVEYENQTKLKTAKKLYATLTKDYIISLLNQYFESDINLIENMLKHIQEVQKHNLKNQKAKKDLYKKLNEKVDILNRIDSLTDCEEIGLQSELFIAEGDSAKTSIVLARNPKNQAVMAIRGKILNCLKSDYDTIFKNDTITDIIKALGTGIEDKKNKDLGVFNLDKLRYGKIIIATDSDADGYQIAGLLLTLFYKLTPTLIKNGNIYITLTPLFEIKTDNKLFYANNESEKESIIKKLGNEKYKVYRNKGLK